MAHYLTTAQLIECAESYFAKDTELGTAVDRLVDAQDRLAVLIAKRCGAEFGATTVDSEQVDSSFEPLDVDEPGPCPEQLRDYDTDSDWAQGNLIG